MGRLHNLVGQRFGRLVVLEQAPKHISTTGRKYTYWLCKCDCGNIKAILASSLRSCTTQSCGCLARENTAKRSTIDLIGQRFGRLVVLAKAKTRRYNNLDWICKCDCGNEVIIVGSNLTIGNTQSCGCYNREQTRKSQQLPGYIAALNALYKSYQTKANLRGLDFYLSLEEFHSLTQSNCHYCESKPLNKQRSRTSSNDYFYNGIDRLDNRLGYILDNCVPCCKICNRAKGELTLDEFHKWVTDIYSILRTDIIE